MKFLAIAAALISVIPAIAGLVINTPAGVVTCQPILLTYGQGTAPYYVSVLPGGQVSGTPFHTWPATDATSMTWVVDLPGGTAVSLVVKDGTGAQAYSDTVTIQGGSDSSCVNSAAAANSSAATTASRPASSGSAATTASAATHAASTSGTPATAGGDTARPAVTQSTSSNAASGGASAASPVNNGAAQLSYAAYGVGGAVGLIGALLL